MLGDGMNISLMLVMLYVLHLVFYWDAGEKEN
jgi:hypothetical protein